METVKPAFLANVPDLTRYPEGSTVEYKDGHWYVWFPRGVRETWTPPEPTVCPTCGRAMASGTVVEELAI